MVPGATYEPTDFAGTVLLIAHLVPPGVHAYSGLLTALVHLAQAQARRGDDVHLWHIGAWPSGAEELLEVLTHGGVERWMFRGRGRRPWLDSSLVGEIAAGAADLVHLHGVFNPFNNRVARRLRVPYVVSPHGGYAPESLAYHAGRKRVFASLLERPMLRGAGAVCALTPAEAADIRRFGVTRPAWVVPNGVVPPSGSVNRGAFRREMGCGAGDRLAVFIGRIDVRGKRLDELVRAVALAPHWRLALVGGDFRDGVRALVEQIERMGAADRIRLIGPRRGAALTEVLASADLFALVSRSEGLPMALLEAAIHGVPALVSPEVERATGVAGSGAGWVATGGAITATLAMIADLPGEERVQRREAAAAYARRHDWDVAAVACRRVYESVMNASRRVTPSVDTPEPVAHA